MLTNGDLQRIDKEVTDNKKIIALINNVAFNLDNGV